MPDLTEETISGVAYHHVVWTAAEVPQLLKITGIDLVQFQQVMGEVLLDNLEIEDVASVSMCIDKTSYYIVQIEFELQTHRVSFGFSPNVSDKPFIRTVSNSKELDRGISFLDAKGKRAEYIRNLLGRLNDSDFGRSVVERIQAEMN